MSAFDELTLGEVEDLTKTCLNGKPIGEDVDPMMLAGGVMWTLAKRNGGADITWAQFKASTTMRDIKAFSTQMEDDDKDPTESLTLPQT